MSDEPSDIKQFLSRVRAAAPSGSLRAVAAAAVSLDDVREPRQATPQAARWTRSQLAGRLVEVSGMGAVASLTAAVGLVLEAQLDGEPVAWIGLPASTFYPPDLADQGIDLDALVVVRAPSVEHAGRAADRLLRSGGFGLVIVDLGPGGKDAALPIPLQGRLVGLAQRHDAVIVCLTEKPGETASLGSMVSLRTEALRARDGDQFTVTIRALKDKQRGPGWTHDEPARGPAGLGR
jgi:recombination protein RecA